MLSLFIQNTSQHFRSTQIATFSKIRLRVNFGIKKYLNNQLLTKKYTTVQYNSEVAREVGFEPTTLGLEDLCCFRPMNDANTDKSRP